ncbi:DUF3987 domain-containing protein [Flavobacteriaceae bacterium 144Ye]|nr:DUF3987 domain-containing protein [Flavobacteriaceae bacterium 144Ye]
MSNTKFIHEQVYENLPEPLKGLTNLFEGRERDIVLLSCLGVLSGCIPKVYGIYDRKKVYANLYVMIIAPPASGKGTMNYGKSLINAIQTKAFAEKQTINEKDSKRKKKVETYIQTKLIPVNISTSEMYALLKNSHYGGIMFDSEADTLSSMFKNDWGNFSDVLRKTFHHESLSISRKMEELFVQIDEPKLSLVLSGTPNQLQPLVQSKENGLFSRFLYYSFHEVNSWKNPFASRENVSVNFEKIGIDVILKMYEILFKKTYEIEFSFSEEQTEVFNSELERISEIILKHHPEGFMSNVMRHGLILFRIAMVLSVIRKYSISQEFPEDTLVCQNDDFTIAASITSDLLYHALNIFNDISGSELNEQEENLLFSLKEIFIRKEAIEKGLKFGIPERTMDEKLKQWRKKKVIRKIKHGKYKRILG